MALGRASDLVGGAREGVSACMHVCVQLASCNIEPMLEMHSSFL